MFHHRSTEFDPRVSAIASHLRAIEKELGGIGKKREPTRLRRCICGGEPNCRRNRTDPE